MSYPGLVCLTPPTSEPIAVDELAMQLRLNDESEYSLLAQYISAARQLFEEYTGRAVMRQQWQATFNRHVHPFHEYQWWEAINSTGRHYHYRLPKSPLQSITSILGDGNDLTGQYTLNATVEPAIISLDSHVDTLVVELWAGYSSQNVSSGEATDVPAIILQSILLLAASYYMNRQDFMPSLGSMTQVPFGFKAVCDTLKVRI